MKQSELRRMYMNGIPSRIIKGEQLSYADWLERLIIEGYVVNKNCNTTAVSESVEPVGGGTVCGLGMKTSECERYNVVKTCNHCPWYS
jgi:hypothetical protein